MIMIPSGLQGLEFAKDMQNPRIGNRSQTFSFELLDNGEAPKGSLPNVTGGNLEWAATAAVKSGGKITVVMDERSQINWLQRRIKITMHIEGLGNYPLGIYIPSAPVENWTDTELTLDIELLDKCSLLDNDYVLESYAVGDGKNVTAAVRGLIVSAGENAGSITDGSETLNKGMSWESGTSKLTIINDLLEAAGYLSLHVDGEGRFRAEKRRLPKSRPIAHEFVDNNHSIYTPVFTYEKDIYSVPNRVVIIAQGDGDKEGMKAVAENTNPNSPYSYQNRGNRWIVDVLKGVEATSQAALNERAQNRLAQLTSPSGLITITHAPLPWLDLNDAVRFKRSTADIDVRAVVMQTAIELTPTALQRTALQEVAEL